MAPTKEQIIGTLFEVMRATQFVQYADLYKRVYGEWLDEHRQPNEDSNNAHLLLMTVSEFERAGLLVRCYIQPSSHSRKVEYHVAPLGVEVAKQGNFFATPTTQDSYINRATSGVLWVSNEVKSILEECYSTWASGHYRAATILIGVACEFILDDFLSALEPLVPSARQPRYSPLFGDATAKTKIKTLKDIFDENGGVRRKALWSATKVEIDCILDLYAHQIRQIRNQMAHTPRDGWPLERVYMALVGIVDYIQQLDATLSFLKATPAIL